MFIFLNLFPVAYEANGAGGGPAGAPQAQPVGGTPTPQPAGQGQGDPSGQGFNWGLFPDVPEDVRPNLEPHLRNVQGHVTRVEQQLAPFKPFVDAGYTPQQVQGLAQFAGHFNQDPAGAWLAMAQQLQADGIIDDDLDLEALTQIATGQVPAPQQPNPAMQGLQPEVAQLIQSLQNEIKELKGGVEGITQQHDKAVSDQMLKNALTNMRTELKKDGWTDEQLQDDRRLARYIAFANGNLQQAIADAKADRSTHLTGFVESQSQDELEITNGGPRPAKPATTTRRNDPWGKPREGAATFLRKQNQAAAQGT